MTLFRQKVLLILMGLTAALFLASLVLSLLRLGDLSYPVILHFDAFNGVNFVGNMTDFWSIWFSGLVIVVLNTWLAGTLFRRERFLSYLFVSVNVLIALLVLIITGVVVSAN
jgi:hypothetical protein